MRRLIENIENMLSVMMLVLLAGTIVYGMILNKAELAGLTAIFMIMIAGLRHYVETQYDELMKYYRD